jgi:hypothetical protein
MSLIQALLARTSTTVRLRRHLTLTAATRSGAQLVMLRLPRHDSSQKRVHSPLPTRQTIEVRKKALDTLFVATGSSAHERELSQRCSHSQWRRGARPMTLRSGMPRLPRYNIHYTEFQAIAHLLPCTESVLVHRKLHIILTMAFLTQARSSRPISVWTGIVANVNLIRARRPLLCINRPFHASSLSAMESISRCQTTLGRDEMDNGIPK